MGLNPRPLSEDSVDSFTHVWSVAFFLSLAFLLLVIPGIPIKNHDQQTQQQQSIAKYHASCWCPSQFQQVHVDYTNDACSAAFNSILRGEDESGYASVHGMFSTIPPSVAQMDDIDVLKTSIANKSRSNKSKDKNDNGKEALQKMGWVWENWPVILIALALGLRVPHLLTSISSMCCSGVNLGQTLESARQGEVMTSEKRRQMYAGLVTGFKGKNTCTYLYLTMKILMIIVIIAEIIIVNNHILPKIKGQEHGNENNLTSSARPTPNGISEPTAELQLNGMVVHCSFKIRAMTNVHHYTVQCVLNAQNHQKSQNYNNNNSNIMAISDSNILSSNVFLMVMVILVLLVFVNVLNTLVWLITLARDSTRTPLGLDKTAPLDLVLFSLMARTHLSMGLVVGLAHAQSTKAGGEYSGVDGDECDLL